MIDSIPESPIPSLEEIGIPINSPIPPGVPDLVPGFLPKQGQLVISGETNIGKSLSALETVSSLVTGKPLWGKLTPSNTIKRVVYVLAEHYPEVIQRLLAKTGLPMADQVFILGPEQLRYDKWLVMRGQPNQAAISKFMKWTEGVDLIVFDPLSAFIVGSGSENDNIEMRVLLDTMSLIAQNANASSMVLAHQGKPVLDPQGREHNRTRYATRGASGVEDAATNIFYLGKADQTQANLPRGSLILDMTCRKYKGDSVDKFRLVRDAETLTHTLVDGASYSDVLKLDARAKVSRLQAEFPSYNYRTCIKIAAAIEGIPDETMRRRLGVKS